MIKSLARLACAIVICEGAGVLGSVFTISEITGWYSSLHKPFFNPPNAIFGPVWTILFLLMGIALFLVWEAKVSAKRKREALSLFFLQLLLNVLWSLLFFGMHSALLGLIDIILLWLAIYFTIGSFIKIKNIAGYLLYPYLAWVSFATILNFAILLLN